MSLDPSEKHRGWLLPAPKNQTLPAGLYLAATPIGNLGDMTLRALDTLARADAVLCEDTRVTRKLLSHFDIRTRVEIYNDHSSDAKRHAVVERMREGAALALVSDAGMPLISDPGYKLVQACAEAGVRVTSLPGANAPLMALQLSALPSDAFCFIGFLPPRQNARRKELARWAQAPGTLIAFETAPRLVECLQDIADVMGARTVCVARELTKLYEEVRRGPAEALCAYYQENGAPKGEIVLLLGPPPPQDWSESDTDEALRQALETMGTKAAAAQVAEMSGQPAKALYQRALAIREQE